MDLAVTTVEGIAAQRDRLHPVQERIAKAHGSQCGFCTPAWSCQCMHYLENSSKPSMKELEIAMQGNLCRCTGYRPIIEGYRTFTKEFGNEEVCGMGEKMLQSQWRKIEVTKDGLKIGAAVTLTEIENFIESKTDQNVIEKSIVEMLHWFAGSQVRNVASIGGNIVTSSPISDLNPILLAAGAKLEVQSLKDGKRIIKMDENFFTGYLSSDQPLTDPIHRPKIHSSALQQATGEAIYCDDIPKHENELYLALVLSTKAHAKIISIDASEALKQPGIHAFFTAKDVDQTSYTNGFMGKDEEIFISETVTSEGQILGAIVGDNQIIAQRAAKLGFPKTRYNGDIKKTLNEADHVIEGEVRLGGQEHFYIETHSNLAIPKDADEIEIFSSTQHPCEMQRHFSKQTPDRNTAFRGFGSPQGMLAAETMIRDVARITGKDYLEIMDLNMCENGYVLHYKQILENCNIRRCFEEVKINSDLENRRKSVAKINSENRWKKRGISIVNNLYPIGFPPKFLNQGGTRPYLSDGSVLVSHGGVEMGQGLHTKMIQVASRVLKVPMEIIHIQETATDKVPNAISTAASVSSDLYVSEVEIDCLTGDHQVIRTDIVMDVGSSLNPAIDIGQIEGAFMQGYGLFVLEELIYSPNGTLYSRGPGMYKIPSFGNIPAEFNVSLLTDAPNPRAVFSSRAVEAIGAARKEEGLDSHFYLQAPATAARIRVACQDKIVEKFESLKDENLTPWNVDL
ncbi:hypothetical protein PVAND_009328 [Polypedilum vanderplanki]|uniref:FAD-binding PCMH-type domain-containing protein n=1 Tax=Polypedilum vanderplanki TaxID=319348 RepID=A0A9J6CDR9_POLVA|nr:hypothetical protein PVAND_009328 [Polypedilum vanderplanki]